MRKSLNLFCCKIILGFVMLAGIGISMGAVTTAQNSIFKEILSSPVRLFLLLLMTGMIWTVVTAASWFTGRLNQNIPIIIF